MSATRGIFMMNSGKGFTIQVYNFHGFFLCVCTIFINRSLKSVRNEKFKIFLD